MNFLASIGKGIGALFSGGSFVREVADVAREYIEDPDKRNELIVEVIKSRNAANATTTVPIFDAIHKLGRQLMWFAIMGMYFYSWQQGKPFPFDELALLMSGPGVYTLMKGRGR